MKIHNLYADDKGESHWRDVEIKYTEATSAGKLSPRLPANGIIFREVQPDYDLDWHPAPRRQYIINLDGAVEITASDGEKRVIGPGEVFLVEQGKAPRRLTDSNPWLKSMAATPARSSQRAVSRPSSSVRPFGHHSSNE